MRFACIVATCTSMAVATGPRAAAAASASTEVVRIAFIPLDDRPATELFPQQITAICGSQLELPPQRMLGHFTTPGDADALERWLLDLDTRGLSAVVISSDMLAYGGLVASRTPATPIADARARLRILTRFHELHPSLPVYVFGTIMRLAPTETPESEPYLEALTNYARLAGAPHLTGDDKAALAESRSKIPDRAFWDYIGARARDLETDEQLITLAAKGDITWLALTQDDAGSPDGLQAYEQRRLVGLASQLGMSGRVLFNPGADEMGMVAVTRATEEALGWSPRVRILYSSPRGPQLQDPLEDVPVGQTVETLARALRMPVVATGQDFTLDVFTPLTPIELRSYYFGRLAKRLYDGEPIALADITFIDDDIGEERVEPEALQGANVAALPMAFASWNTTANTAGTALSAAACSALARHFGHAATDAQTTFLFDRYVDDYAYRLLVRPELNADLRSAGFDTFALGDASSYAESQVRHRLWPLAVDWFDANFAPAGWKQSELSMYLPWQRTFEVQINADLTRTVH
jgi:hypothetical protein